MIFDHLSNGAYHKPKWENDGKPVDFGTGSLDKPPIPQMGAVNISTRIILFGVFWFTAICANWRNTVAKPVEPGWEPTKWTTWRNQVQQGGWLSDWWIDRSIRLFSWLVDWLVGWLVGCDWLVLSWRMSGLLPCVQARYHGLQSMMRLHVPHSLARMKEKTCLPGKLTAASRLERSSVLWLVRPSKTF
jgi:hypothetical protein